MLFTKAILTHSGPALLTSLLLITLIATAPVRCTLADDPNSPEKPEPIPVVLEQIDGAWRLLRDGTPYVIKGAGGNGSLALLATCGANSVRTWGVDGNTEALLDEAHKNNISVTFGIWLEHERHGFDYNDVQAVARQTETVMQAVRKFKNHPAILVWGIGNEMEGYETGDNPKIWKHIEDLCQKIKREDPNHPVMSVIAEIGGNKLPAINQHCPSLDIIGINSYAGAGSLPERYRTAGGKKPYIVTEFGPPGTWEVEKNNFDSIEEPTSNAKATSYLNTYQSLQKDRQFCLGSYAFLWGNKQEATPTWFGMLLPDGKKTAAVDAMTEQWSGKPAENLSPIIDELKLEGPNQVKGNEIVKFKLKARDPEGKPINTRWLILPDTKEYITNGDPQAAPMSLPGRIQSANQTGATIQMPETSGLYRVYAYVDDGNGGAVGNVVLQVDGKPAGKTGLQVKLPYVLYDEDTSNAAYIPSGWMGEADFIKLNTQATVLPKSGKTCMQCEFEKPDGWGGVVWQNPQNDWGDKIGGLDLSGAKKLSFWIRGEKGGERVKFGFGMIGRDKKYYDTAKAEVEVRLETDWRKVTIDLTDKELHRIKTGFYWVASGQGEPLKFYVDQVIFE